jgi:preprotein translocase subunit SecG
MSFLYYFLLFLFLFVCTILCFVILLQDSKSMGLGASFGGDAGDALFGTSTAFVLKKFTAYLAVIFMGGCLILSLWTASIGRAQMPQSQPVEEVEKE